MKDEGIYDPADFYAEDTRTFAEVMNAQQDWHDRCDPTEYDPSTECDAVFSDMFDDKD